jgi:hypothetical protein
MGHLAPHQYVPLWPSERSEMAAQEQAAVAKDGDACMNLADNIASLCDRKPHEWDARDAALVTQLRGLLTEAREIAERLS